MDHERTAVGFFGAMGMNPTERVGEFVAAWGRVKCPDGQDAWDAAVGLAEGGPAKLNPSPGITYATLGRVVYHLQEMAPGKPILVPVRRVAELYGITKQGASAAIRTLVKVGVLAVEDGTYSYVEGKAKTYRCVARPA